MDDHTTWRDWCIPANDETLFRVSINCNECIIDEKYENNTAYYATGDYLCFICLKRIIYSDIYCNECDDVNIKPYSQPYNDEDDSGTYEMWEQSKYIRYNSDILSSSNHYYCTHREPFVCPSLRRNGEGCTCYKPSETNIFEVSLSSAVGTSFEIENSETFSANDFYGIDNNIWWWPRSSTFYNSCTLVVFQLNVVML